jgi:hypothetical protein
MAAVRVSRGWAAVGSPCLEEAMKTAPREPCCDLASRGTHRRGCTGEPMSKQLADALGIEVAPVPPEPDPKAPEPVADHKAADWRKQ